MKAEPATCHSFLKHCSRRLAGLLLLAALLSFGSRPACAQEIKLTVSSAAGDRMTDKTSLTFMPNEGQIEPSSFHIDESLRYQTIEGFGASFLEAGLICINSLPADKQEEVLRSLFDPEQGAGFSVMKTVMAGTDFMSAGPWYSYNDTAGDVEMKHFSIVRDIGPNGQVTFIRRARKYGNFVLEATMDFPPDWMLIRRRRHQTLSPDYYDALALYYLRFIQAYAKQGIVIDYLALFNEPGVYTRIDYDAIAVLLKNHVAPMFAREGVTTKLMLCEAPSRREAFWLYPTVLYDLELRKYLAAIPYHGYDFGNFSSIAKLHQRYPGLPLWMSEICSYANQRQRFDLPRYDFEDGAFWGGQIVSDLEAGASAWLYWNMVLDEKGGPWLVSPSHGNPMINVQHPVVIVNRQTQDVTYTGCYYYLAHFSKFVRPGAVRIETAGSMPNVRCIAFETPEKTFVAQLLNSGDTETTATLSWNGRTAQVSLLPYSITTCRWAVGQ